MKLDELRDLLVHKAEHLMALAERVDVDGVPLSDRDAKAVRAVQGEYALSSVDEMVTIWMRTGSTDALIDAHSSLDNILKISK